MKKNMLLVAVLFVLGAAVNSESQETIRVGQGAY